MKGVRAFEMFVIALVIGVAVCFCVQLSMIKDTSAGEVFRGFLPSSAIVQSQGLVSTVHTLKTKTTVKDPETNFSKA